MTFITITAWVLSNLNSVTLTRVTEVSTITADSPVHQGEFSGQLLSFEAFDIQIGIGYMRIRASWIFLLAVASLFLFSTSAWEVYDKRVAEFLFVSGLFLAGIGAFGRLWCSVYIAGYKTDTLITTGPYSLCRNPLYFFSLVGGLGVGLASETLTIPVIILIAFGVYYPFVIRKEEETLRVRHGDVFGEYQKKVPRFFPRIRAFRETEQQVVHLVVFRKHLWSAIWFIWIPGLAELVELLHENHCLPSWFRIY